MNLPPFEWSPLLVVLLVSFILGLIGTVVCLGLFARTKDLHQKINKKTKDL
jgi:uncharacterized integral membrane protein